MILCLLTIFKIVLEIYCYCLSYYFSNQLNRLDNRIKETNMIYQIFGGYLQSQVTCLECKYKSNTFDPCLDISLDIKGCDSIKRAFELFVRSETLTQSNKYKCSR